jgi:NAD(P)H-dependent flavin oxidoreductase YrpB (nitropropane dioxygenase family)
MTPLARQLGIAAPILQAPMNWATDATLVAAVSEAGGLGCLGPNAGARTPTEDVDETGERLRAQIAGAAPAGPTATAPSMCCWRSGWAS